MSASIVVDGLSKRYRAITAGQPGYRSMREAIVDSAGACWERIRESAFGASRRTEEPARQDGSFWALKDVAFKVSPGEMVGVIGRNGAGKSTLLKILSRITQPTDGKVEIRGRLGSLLEVGTGFHPELTGRENIFLYGAILGMTRSEIVRRFDDIVEFAETERFVNTPVKRYSSGMYVRLAFSVAAHLNPHVLLVDEVLSVGDLGFQRKCVDYLKRLRKSNTTVLLVSHNMFAVKAMCERCIYLSNGRVEFDGRPEAAIQLYEKDSRLGSLPWAQKSAECPINVAAVELLDESGQPRTVYRHGERLRARVTLDCSESIEDLNLIFSIIRSDDVACCNFSTALDGFIISPQTGQRTVELVTPPLKLVSELYAVHLLIRDRAFNKIYSAQSGPTFHVSDDLLSPDFGVFHEAAQWSWLN
jgi:lipopolysaccharide transport system ATP-binding protein